MARVKFSESILINCSSEFAFDYTQDYNNRLKWDTFLKRAELMGSVSKAGVGVRADCVAKNGFGMITEYVSFNRPEGTAIKMTKGPFMFKSFAGSWKFLNLEPYLTEVIFIYSFELRFPFSLFQEKIKRNLQQNVKQRLIDLKGNIEATSATIKPRDAGAPMGSG